jgi:hypothetical protein
MNASTGFSKEELTSRLTDYFYVYLVPAICGFGILTNLANIVVTWQLNLSLHVKYFILVNSFLDFGFLFVRFFSFLIRCGSLCPYGYLYESKFYDLYIYLFFSFILITCQALFNLHMSIERLGIFTKQTVSVSHLSLKWFILAYFLAATLINTPTYIFSNQISLLLNNSANTSKLLYTIQVKEDFKSGIGKIAAIVSVLIKSCLIYISMGMINIWTAILFPRFLQKKRQMQQTHLEMMTAGKSWVEFFENFSY